jgi:hypothetical protein
VSDERLAFINNNFDAARGGKHMAACIPNTEFHHMTLDLRDARATLRERDAELARVKPVVEAAKAAAVYAVNVAMQVHGEGQCCPECPDEYDGSPCVGVDRTKALAAAVDAYRAAEREGEPAIARPKIICLCGSGRFREAFEQAEYGETLAGRIVLTIGCNAHDVARSEELAHHKPMLDELHLRKIDLADEVLVLNVGGYVGQSTRREIEYATARGKPLRYLEPQGKPAPGEGGTK